MDPNQDLDYGALIEQVSRVAAGLAERGLGEGDRVALLLPNSVDFVVAALACLWRGAVFVPLAVTDPELRLTQIVSDSLPALVITGDERTDAVATRTSLAGVDLVAFSAMGSAASPRVAPVAVAPRAAYIIYTSGTSGTPKGVQIGSVAFTHVVAAIVEAFGFTGDTRTLCVSPFHFDGSYANLFPTLFAGGSLVIWPRDALLFPRTFVNLVEREGVTFSGFTASYFRLLLSSAELSRLAHSRLSIIAIGGEAFSATDLRSWWEVLPSVRAFNRYGPTETAITVTNTELTPALIADGAVPIGAPNPGVDFHLVDDAGRLIDEPGRVGELFVGGAQLMDGYWAAPDLSREVLREDIVPGEVVYRTGDLVYRRADGLYVYVGRADRVVKRGGVRVSLVEMSDVLQEVEGVSAVACTTYDNDGSLDIVAFVVADEGLTVVDIRRAALRRLPETMLPGRIELVDALPLNRSNKLDERLLLERAGLRPFTP